MNPARSVRSRRSALPALTALTTPTFETVPSLVLGSPNFAADINASATHLTEVFGSIQVRHRMYDRLRLTDSPPALYPVHAPPEGSEIRIRKAHETCHRSSGTGLIDQTVPPGEYRVGKLHAETHSHWLQLFPLESASRFKELQLVVGYGADVAKSCVDWRSVTKIN